MQELTFENICTGALVELKFQKTKFIVTWLRNVDRDGYAEGPNDDIWFMDESGLVMACSFEQMKSFFFLKDVFGE